MKQPFSILLIGLLTMTSIACSDEVDPRLEQESFTKIYDNNKFSNAYKPISVKQTSDGGYVILGSRTLQNSNYAGIYLMKVGPKGEFVSETEVDPQYVNPVGDMIALGGQLYFFCMEEVSLSSQLVQLDENLEGLTFTPLARTYPCAANVDGNSLLLLNYNHVDKLFEISLVNTSGGELASKGFSIGVGEDIEEPIINHFIKGGEQLPFAVGRLAGSSYYFNGFFNYTFSLVFTDLNQDDPTGVVQGQQDDGGLSSLVPISGSKVATSRFNFGDNYIIPNANLSTSSITSSVDLGGYTFLELVPNAKVDILRTAINGRNVLIYGSDTQSGQIGLYIYDENTAEFIGSTYVGSTYPFRVADVIATSDEGILVCGTTSLAGRFPRVSLTKISKETLAGYIQ
jgi:hypothetical protein